MDTIVKRIRDFAQELNISLNQKILIDDDNYTEDEEFKHLTIQQLLNFFLNRIDFGGLEIYVTKPVISIATELPTANVNIGDRYFIVAGDLALKIAEWNGASWNIIETKTGDCIYSYSQKKFIIRTTNFYEFSSTQDSFERTFENAVEVEVRHNLDRYPSVIAMDSSNRSFVCQVEYPDRYHCIVSWVGETSGRIICN
jgi:hypothetical protein